MNATRFTARLARLVILAALGTSLVACVSVPMSAPTANGDTVQSIRGAAIVKSKVGEFKLAAGKDADLDTSLSGLRGSSLKPNDHTFSNDLRNVIIVDLQTAGLIDNASTSVITGELTDSMVDAAMGTGKGRLAAHFKVTRDGNLVYDKELAVDAQWDSSFIGAIAIPAAMQGYSALYEKLAAKLFADPDFRKALAR